MSYSRLIHNYLDGQLVDAEEDELFNGLANNPELRNEFNQQIRLGVAAQADMGSISPPMDSTNMIFSSLGFSIPSSDYIDSVKPAVLTKSVWDLARRYGAMIAVAVISAAITSLLFMISNNSSDKTGTEFASSVKSGIPVVRSVEGQDNASIQAKGQPASRNRTGPDSRGAFARNNSTVNDGTSINGNKDANTAEVNFKGADRTFTPKELTEINNLEINHSSNASNRLGNTGYRNMHGSMPTGGYSLTISPDMFNAYGSASSDVTVEYRGFMSKSNPEPMIDGKGLNLLNNVGLAFIYKFDEHHSAGLEFGRENMVLQYAPSAGSGLTVNKNPELFWYGAFYRFSVPELGIGSFVMPYGQLMAGGTVIGPLVRYQAGLMFRPWSVVSMNIGYEGTQLFFPYQGNWYNTNKHGLTAGIGVNLNLFK